MQVKCAVAGIDANGCADIWFVIVECTEEQRDLGDHLSAAEESADENGYEGPFVVFDEDDPIMRYALMSVFEWSTSSIKDITCQPIK